ncbi:MAG: hypothetical protein KDK91_29940, partial [Gammaproteobacteria bacterium]|nr:hypothetical protein [Gammaproteobacteria bacterium]
WVPVVEQVGPGNVALGGAAAGTGGAGGLTGGQIAGYAAGAIVLGVAADRINDNNEDPDPVSP